MRYYIPDWDDYLDPGFDFERDRFSAPSRKDRNDVYAHEIFGADTPYDGMLVSLAQLGGSKGILGNGRGDPEDRPDLRSQLRLPKRLVLMGDCGAFSYSSEPRPPITPARAAKLYEAYGFDVGVSVDHIPVLDRVTRDEQGRRVKEALTEEERRQRVKVTRANGLAFLRYTQKQHYNFAPMGALQGISADDYADMFDRFYAAGYRHFAVGGLVPRSDADIAAILSAVDAARRGIPYAKRRRLRIHVLGVFRPALQPQLPKWGVTSFDSATYFRKAWLRSTRNYLTPQGQWYAALRVPQSNEPRMRRRAELNGQSPSDVERLEFQVLKRLMHYGEGGGNARQALAPLLEYDRLYPRIFENADRIRDAYERTLVDRPWEKCDCKICSELGIHVVIFRGFNRNKRRGFHNTLMLYGSLKKRPSAKSASGA